MDYNELVKLERELDLHATDRIHEPHEFLGIDNEGNFHHWYKAYDRTHITQEGGKVYVINDEGLLLTRNLHGHSIHDWLDHVEKAVGGWQVEPNFLFRSTGGFAGALEG